MNGWTMLGEERIAQIARECEVENHAVPGATMWMCAEMAIRATLEAISEGASQIAEVCEDADGFKHIEAVIEDLDDVPAGARLYSAPKANLPSLTDEQMLDAIKAVCGFDSEGVERWRTEALIIARAIERALVAEAAK